MTTGTETRLSDTARRRRFRDLLSGPSCVYPASVFDPVSARIAEDLGFEAGMLAGSIAALTVLGAPDLVLLTLSEFAEQIRRICRASNLPLLVDADHGYGNALNVMRTVEELETAGVAALTIEDTVLPVAFGQSGPAKLISLEEGVGKMRAALHARRDDALVIVGRTSTPMLTGIEDTIARCKAYEAAGVDALFISGMRKRAELEALSARVSLPIILGRAEHELVDPEHLVRHHVPIALQGHQPMAATVQAIHDTLKALREGTPPEKLQGLATTELMGHTSRDSLYRAWTAEFLGIC
ncbi:oxaloacetate decarboxylase [Betaproteobacteria bacterium]|nr:oxaloacetate decarboxylase [Betaproteobacteria bacterium]